MSRQSNEASSPGTSGTRRPELGSALIGGAITALVAFGGLATVGRVSPFRAFALLEAIVPSIRFLSGSALTAGATILALMLTLLSFTATHEHDFTVEHYERIKQISMLNSVLIILSMFLLMVLSVPLEEAETFRRLYTWVYFGVVLLMSLLGGILIAVVVMLQATIRGLINALHPHADSMLVHSHERADDAPADDRA